MTAFMFWTLSQRDKQAGKSVKNYHGDKTGPREVPGAEVLYAANISA